MECSIVDLQIGKLRFILDTNGWAVDDDSKHLLQFDGRNMWVNVQYKNNPLGQLQRKKKSQFLTISLKLSIVREGL